MRDALDTLTEPWVSRLQFTAVCAGLAIFQVDGAWSFATGLAVLLVAAIIQTRTRLHLDKQKETQPRAT